MLRKYFLFFLATLIFSSGIAYGAGVYTVTILVSDKNGVVQSASVILSSQSYNATQSTDTNGQAIFLNVPGDTYTLTVSKSGYETKTQSISISKDNTFPVVLTLSSGNMTVQTTNSITGQPLPNVSITVTGPTTQTGNLE